MYNSGNSSKNVRGSEIIDGTVEAADLATAVNNDIADGVAGKATADLALPKAGGTMTGAISLEDAVKAFFGDGNDLQIYHSGTESFIVDAGTGNLNIQADSLSLLNAVGSEYYARFYTNGAANLYHNGNKKINTSGTGVEVTGNATVTGNLVIGTSGKGIDFSAATPDGTGSTGSEVLDDYEEGTFTPALLFGGASVGMTYSTQTGTYTKIGDTVHFQIVIRLSAKGTSVGNATITGLPFSTTLPDNAWSTYWTNVGTGLEPMFSSNASSTVVYLFLNVSGSSANSANTTYTDTSRIAVSGTYKT